MRFYAILRCYHQMHESFLASVARLGHEDVGNPSLRPDQRIGGQCPLELAGYDISQIPIARILRGQLLGWPLQILRGLVPKA